MHFPLEIARTQQQQQQQPVERLAGNIIFNLPYVWKDMDEMAGLPVTGEQTVGRMLSSLPTLMSSVTDNVCHMLKGAEGGLIRNVAEVMRGVLKQRQDRKEEVQQLLGHMSGNDEFARLVTTFEMAASAVDELGKVAQLASQACTALPVGFCCNNLECRKLANVGELSLVLVGKVTGSSSGGGGICGGCGQAVYSSKACQDEHWAKGHKEVCKLLKRSGE